MVPWRSSVPRKRSNLAPASFIDPCLPTRADKAPIADGWVHEIKHDGFRLQIHARKDRVRLYTMTGVDWTERYPWIVQDVARLNIGHAVIDAECCSDDDSGITDFNRLQARVHDASAYAYAFDLLAVEGTDTRGLPLSERKAALAKLLRKAKPGIRYSEHLVGNGAEIFEQACRMGLEGIVSKRFPLSIRQGKDMAQDQKSEVTSGYADHGGLVDYENRIWTCGDFRALKAALRTSRNIQEAAKRLDRPTLEVEEMTRDLGWLKPSHLS